MAHKSLQKHKSGRSKQTEFVKRYSKRNSWNDS